MSLEFEPLSLKAKRVDLSVKELAAKIEFNPESDPYTLASATAKLYDCDYVSSMCETILANKVEKFWPQGGEHLRIYLNYTRIYVFHQNIVGFIF